MTSQDIVKRLRERYPQLEIDTDRKSVAWEAADEIERLCRLCEPLRLDTLRCR